MSFMSRVRVALIFLYECSVLLKSVLYFIDRLYWAYFGLIHSFIISSDWSKFCILFGSKGIVGYLLFYLPTGEFDLLKLFLASILFCMLYMNSVTFWPCIRSDKFSILRTYVAFWTSSLVLLLSALWNSEHILGSLMMELRIESSFFIYFAISS